MIPIPVTEEFSRCALPSAGTERIRVKLKAATNLVFLPQDRFPHTNIYQSIISYPRSRTSETIGVPDLDD